jgi:SSS family solute:Na+ symporter
LFARNVLRPFRQDLSDRSTLLVSRLSMVVFAAIAVWLTVGQQSSLVDILLYAYSAIGMLAPGVFLAFLWRPTAISVLLGIVAGFIALLAPFAKDFWAAQLPEWEPGLIAMLINLVVVVAVTVLTPQRQPVLVKGN